VDREVIATRRVTGPRREEVATRTGVSTDLPREDGARHGNELGFVQPWGRCAPGRLRPWHRLTST